MESHQRYFPLEDPDGALMNAFVVVHNGSPARTAAIVAGHERVIRARLADAAFFYHEDLKVPMEDWVARLETITFQKELGSMSQKVGRVERLTEALAGLCGADAGETAQAVRAAHLCKADLVSHAVVEFPSLQGVMGRYYAKLEGEAPAVADAIAEHYAPLGPNDHAPTAPVSIAVALADKIDTLVGFWAVKEKPTGSKDPYALRRAALGAIRLIIENDLRYGLLVIFRVAFESYEAQGLKFDANELRRDLLEFFADRMKAVLKEKGVRHDLVASIFAHKREDGLGEDDLVRLLARVDALAKFLASEDGANLLTASKRAGNILRIEEKKDGRDYKDLPDPSLLRLPEEFNLVESMKEARERAETALKREAFGVAMAALAKLRGPVDDFFDRVTVNCEDESQRVNRLRLLSRIRTTLNTVADFSKIEA
jgi:glycyl-tRNA synthetase beta chain